MSTLNLHDKKFIVTCVKDLYATYESCINLNKWDPLPLKRIPDLWDKTTVGHCQGISHTKIIIAANSAQHCLQRCEIKPVY